MSFETGEWSLARDKELLGSLEEHSAELLSKVAKIPTELGKLEKDATDMNLMLQNVIGELNLLSERRFIENRVADVNEVKPPPKPLPERRQATEEELREAVRIGLKAFGLLPAEELTDNDPSAFEYYARERPVSLIIGTKEWLEADPFGGVTPVGPVPVSNTPISEAMEDLIITPQSPVEVEEAAEAEAWYEQERASSSTQGVIHDPVDEPTEQESVPKIPSRGSLIPDLTPKPRGLFDDSGDDDDGDLFVIASKKKSLTGVISSRKGSSVPTEEEATAVETIKPVSEPEPVSFIDELKRRNGEKPKDNSETLPKPIDKSKLPEQIAPSNKSSENTSVSKPKAAIQPKRRSLFDSDSDSEIFGNQPQKSVSKTVPSQPPAIKPTLPILPINKPVTEPKKQSKTLPQPSKRPSLFEDSDSDSDIFGSKTLSSVKPVIKPAERAVAASVQSALRTDEKYPGVRVLPTEKALPASSVTESSGTEKQVHSNAQAAPRDAQQLKKRESIFDDSDSDSEIFGAKKPPSVQPSKPSAEPTSVATKPPALTVPKEQTADGVLSSIPKEAPLSRSNPVEVKPQPTFKPEEKFEAKLQPAEYTTLPQPTKRRSLFDDSDSDSEIFGTKIAPPPVTPKEEPTEAAVEETKQPSIIPSRKPIGVRVLPLLANNGSGNPPKSEKPNTEPRSVSTPVPVPEPTIKNQTSLNPKPTVRPQTLPVKKQGLFSSDSEEDDLFSPAINPKGIKNSFKSPSATATRPFENLISETTQEEKSLPQNISEEKTIESAEPAPSALSSGKNILSKQIESTTTIEAEEQLSKSTASTEEITTPLEPETALSVPEVDEPRQSNTLKLEEASGSASDHRDTGISSSRMDPIKKMGIGIPVGLLDSLKKKQQELGIAKDKKPSAEASSEQKPKPLLVSPMTPSTSTDVSTPMILKSEAKDVLEIAKARSRGPTGRRPPSRLSKSQPSKDDKTVEPTPDTESTKSSSIETPDAIAEKPEPVELAKETTKQSEVVDQHILTTTEAADEKLVEKPESIKTEKQELPSVSAPKAPSRQKKSKLFSSDSSDDDLFAPKAPPRKASTGKGTARTATDADSKSEGSPATDPIEKPPRQMSESKEFIRPNEQPEAQPTKTEPVIIDPLSIQPQKRTLNLPSLSESPTEQRRQEPKVESSQQQLKGVAAPSAKLFSDPDDDDDLFGNKKSKPDSIEPKSSETEPPSKLEKKIAAIKPKTTKQSTKIFGSDSDSDDLFRKK